MNDLPDTPNTFSLSKETAIAGDKNAVSLSQAGWNNFCRQIHWPVNIVIGALWSMFVIRAFNAFLVDRLPLSLGLVIANTIVMFLFLARKEPIQVSSHLFDWIVPVPAICIPMFLRPCPAVNSAFQLASAGVQLIAITGIILSLLTLGRRFGVIPANRTITFSGAYQRVRHPLYAFEQFFYFGFIMGNFSIENLIFFVSFCSAQWLRARAEERLLAQDNQYAAYLTRVRHRFIPGIL